MNIKHQFIKRLNLSPLIWPFLKNGLYCFNFHRIGSWQETSYDPCVFSCDAENFEQYLLFIKNNFRVISLHEVNNIAENNTPITEALALITFDDGYSDNYHTAFPLLKSLELPATFFITTSLIDSNIIPWWDEIAWHVRQLANKTIKLTPWHSALTIDKTPSRENIRNVLQQIKINPSLIESQLDELRALTPVKISNNEMKSIFMTWHQITEMVENNMTIGAHSHTHKVFSCLSEVELNFELKESKRLLELNLSKSIDSLSYPVGNATTYNKSMYGAILSNGYKLAFSFSAIINNNLNENRFQIGRFPIDRPFNERVFKEIILSAKSK
ncbi:MAG: polysaccharide deacetylase family protein [Colwellia sp.]|nr:polysaccharide deacetylase family protein [Colwellia sp.]